MQVADDGYELVSASFGLQDGEGTGKRVGVQRSEPLEVLGEPELAAGVSGPIGSTAVETIVEFATLLVDEYEEATRPELASAAAPGTSDP